MATESDKQTNLWLNKEIVVLPFNDEEKQTLGAIGPKASHVGRLNIGGVYYGATFKEALADNVNTIKIITAEETVAPPNISNCQKCWLKVIKHEVTATAKVVSAKETAKVATASVKDEVATKETAKVVTASVKDEVATKETASAKDEVAATHTAKQPAKEVAAKDTVNAVKDTIDEADKMASGSLGSIIHDEVQKLANKEPSGSLDQVVASTNPSSNQVVASTKKRPLPKYVEDKQGRKSFKEPPTKRQRIETPDFSEISSLFEIPKMQTRGKSRIQLADASKFIKNGLFIKARILKISSNNGITRILVVDETASILLTAFANIYDSLADKLKNGPIEVGKVYQITTLVYMRGNGKYAPSLKMYANTEFIEDVEDATLPFWIEPRVGPIGGLNKLPESTDEKIGTLILYCAEIKEKENITLNSGDNKLKQTVCLKDVTSEIELDQWGDDIDLSPFKVGSVYCIRNATLRGEYMGRVKLNTWGNCIISEMTASFDSMALPIEKKIKNFLLYKLKQ